MSKLMEEEQLVKETSHQAWMMITEIERSFVECKTMSDLRCTSTTLKNLSNMIAEKIDLFDEATAANERVAELESELEEATSRIDPTTEEVKNRGDNDYETK